MPQKKLTTVKVRPFVLEPLRELQAAVEREFGCSSRQDEMVGALIAGTTVPQAAGMLMTYIRDTAERDTAASDEAEDSPHDAE